MKKIVTLMIVLFIIPIVALAGSCDYKIGNTCYDESKHGYNALAFKNNDTIVIQEDGSSWHFQSNVNAPNITIDLNGHKTRFLYYFSPKINIDSENYDARTKWTIVDSSSSKTGKVSANMCVTSNVGCADVVFNNIKITKQLYPIADNYSSQYLNSMTLKNCTFEEDKLVDSVSVNFGYATNGVIIDGGTYSGLKIGSSVTINSGTFRNVKFTGGTIVVNNGTFESSIIDPDNYVFSGPTSLTIKNGNFTLYTDKLLDNSTGTSTINGGDFTGEGILFSNNSSGTININGGTFDTKGKIFTNSSSGTIRIAGGTLTTEKELFDNNNKLYITSGTLKTTTTGSAFLSPGVIYLNGGTIDAKDATGATLTTIELGVEGATPTTETPVLDIRKATLIDGSSENNNNKFIIFFHNGTMYLKNRISDSMRKFLPDGYKIQYSQAKDKSYMATLVPTDTPDPTNNYVLGDWNLDKKFDTVDLALYREYLAKKNPDITISGTSATKKYSQLDETHKDYLDLNDSHELDLPDLVQARLELAKKTNQ